MKLKYLGHSAFSMILGDGRRILFDPYEPGAYDGAVGFASIKGVFDLVIVSHSHPDHRWEKAVESAGDVVDKAGEYDFGGIRVTALSTFHDDCDGSERGINLVSIVETEGVRVAHLGDLGHMITAEEMPALSGVDVMLIPVGGHFTIDAKTASKIAREMGPKIVVPMHFKTAKLGFPIATVDRFVQLMDNVETTGRSELEIPSSGLPSKKRVVVLTPAM